jgi:hypothetical protein
MSHPLKTEHARRQSNTAKLREFFEARPNTWVNAVELEDVAGRQAWRTRVSELRQRLERENAGTIENRQMRRAYAAVSEYRFLPHVPLGRDAGMFVERGWTNDGPYQEDFRLKP